jgi:mono/diheme cytochrome c family protein
MDMKRILIIIGSPVLLFFACGSNGMAGSEGRGPKDRGAQLFNMHCSLCHGRDGGLGLNGAKDLRLSTLTAAEMKAIVLNGKGVMMPYKNALTPAEIDAVVDHVRSLRVNE